MLKLINNNILSIQSLDLNQEEFAGKNWLDKKNNKKILFGFDFILLNLFLFYINSNYR